MLENDRLNVYQHFSRLSRDADKLRPCLSRLSRRTPLPTSELDPFPYPFPRRNSAVYLFIRKNCVCDIKLCTATFVRGTRKGAVIAVAVSLAVRKFPEYSPLFSLRTRSVSLPSSLEK